MSNLPRQRALYPSPQWRTEKAKKTSGVTRPTLESDYQSITGLQARSVADESLVRAQLPPPPFLKEAGDYKAYAPYLKEDYLKALFAEAKIVNGIGDPERWASLLSPAPPFKRSRTGSISSSIPPARRATLPVDR